MDQVLIPSDKDIAELKNQVSAIEKRKEYNKLVNTIKQSTHEAFQENMISDGQMQVNDSYQVLKAKRKVQSFMDMIIQRLLAMISFKPIIGNIIAIGLAAFALYYVYHQIDLAGFAKYKHYFGTGIEIFGAIQIIKSGTRSLLLPLIAMIWGGIVAHSLGAHELLFTFDKTFYEYLMIVGTIGLGISVLTIE